MEDEREAKEGPEAADKKTTKAGNSKANRHTEEAVVETWRMRNCFPVVPPHWFCRHARRP